MRTLPIFCLLLASQSLVGCEALGLHNPWKREPVVAAQGPVSGAPDTAVAAEQCPPPEQVVCSEPEVKVVERVIERRFEKLVEVPVAKDKLVLGSVETVSIEPGGLTLDAQIDTASSTSSLSARELKRFERDGKDWVRFKLLPPGSDAKPTTIELPVKRYTRIAHPGFESQRRPVVDMSLTVGEVTHMVEVNLTDRNSLKYPLLMGRNFLKDAAVVDVSRRFVQGRPKASFEK